MATLSGKGAFIHAAKVLVDSTRIAKGMSSNLVKTAIKSAIESYTEKRQKALREISVSTPSFWLQEQQMLGDEMSLADQCIQSEGLVQIKVEIANTEV